eukprot:tig00021179_g19231.t1
MTIPGSTRLNTDALIAAVRACTPFKSVKTGEWEIPLEPFLNLMSQLATACMSLGSLLKSPSSTLNTKVGLIKQRMREFGNAFYTEVYGDNSGAKSAGTGLCSCFSFLESAPEPSSGTRRIATVQGLVRFEFANKRQWERNSAARATVSCRWALDLATRFVADVLHGNSTLKKSAEHSYRETFGKFDNAVVRQAVKVALDGLPTKEQYYAAHSLNEPSVHRALGTFEEEAQPVLRSIAAFTRAQGIDTAVH